MTQSHSSQGVSFQPPEGLPRWTDGYRTLIGPFRHEAGWRVVLAWPGLEEPRDYTSWREAHDDYVAIITAWTDPDSVPMADG